MSSFKDIFAYSDEEFYTICKENDFNKEIIEKICGNYHISFSHVQYRARCYAVSEIYHSLLKVPDRELDFFYNENSRKVIRKYQIFLLEEPFLNITVQTKDMKDVWHAIQSNLLFFFEKVNYDKNIIEKKCREWKLPYQETVDLIARFYINSNRKQARDDMDSIKAKFGHLTNKRMEIVYDLLDRILKAKTDEEVIEIANSSVQLFKSGLMSDYVMLHHEANYDAVMNDLKRKLSMYNDYKHDLRIEQFRKKCELKRDNDYEIAKQVLTDFCNSEEESIEDFCRDYNIRKTRLKYYEELLSSRKDPIYLQYKNKIDKINRQNYKYKKDISRRIIESIKSGVIVNDEVKEFDIIDYYFITKFSPKKLFQFIKSEFDIDDIKCYVKFYSNYSNSSLLNERKLNILLDSREVFGIKMNDDGVAIPNSGREVTLEEKLYILDYLKKNDIPLYDDVYRIALQRYVTNTLENKDDSKKLFVKES